MKTIWIIAKRDLKSYFDSLIAYILLILFLGFSGFFTWLYENDIFLINQASLGVFFNIAYWTLFFFIPALTMRLLAEEKRSGTIELLLTRPVSDRQLVIGKYLAALMLIGIALAFTLPYYFSLSNLGDVDEGAVFGGYLGLIMISSAYISIGLFTSSVTNNQIVAFLGALVIGMFFQILFGALANNTQGSVQGVFDYLNLYVHYESIIRGVIDTRDIIFFLSLTVFALFLSEVSLAQRNLED